ncbi:MAG: lipid A deacylase LpxR family protein [Planctomycetota bacterium]
MRRSAPTSPHRARRAPWLIAASIALSCGGPELYIENDVFAPGGDSDENYTHGTRIQYTFPAAEAPAWSQPVINWLNPFRWEQATEIGLTIGQQIFTPQDLSRSDVIEDDRPYAGWLFGGIARYDCTYDEDDEHRRDTQVTTEYAVGVLGPPSLGEQFQTWFHDIFGSTEPMGWDNQLDTEPTVMMSLQRQDRIWADRAWAIDFDFLTRFGASVGTPVTNAFVGGMWRAGWQLPRDFAATPTNPSLSYTALSRRSEKPVSAYVFAGVVGRGVAYSSFLDGNLVADSHSVTREPWVGDFEYGGAVQVGRFRVGLTIVERTPEFEERDENHVFGSLHISWTLVR